MTSSVCVDSHKHTCACAPDTARHYGFGHAVDTSTSTLYTQSENQSVHVLELANNKSLPVLPGTSGTQFLCMQYDTVLKRLIGIVNLTSTMQLVMYLPDKDQPRIISLSHQWDTKTFPGNLDFFHHDDKPDRFPPECS